MSEAAEFASLEGELALAQEETARLSAQLTRAYDREMRQCLSSLRFTQERMRRLMDFAPSDAQRHRVAFASSDIDAAQTKLKEAM